MPNSPRLRVALAVFAAALLPILASADTPIGDFETAADVGKVDLPGSSKFDPATKQYTLVGSGENMWKTTDAFHFLYRKLSGDWSLAADITWPSESKAPHRKAGLIFRESLEADAPYVDLISHGEGLIALQYRSERGGATVGVNATIKAPATLKLERHGDTFTASVAPKGEPFQPVGSFKLAMKDPLYAGLVVCSHDAKASETAVFSNVSVKAEAAAGETGKGK